MDTWETLGPYRLRQREGLPKLGRDSLLLGAFAALRPGWRVCDLGCGSGALALLLARRAAGLTLDGLDLLPDCAALAAENLRANGLTGCVLTGDVAALPRELPAGQYDLVIANPPYFAAGRGGAAAGARGTARTGVSFAPWCAAARRLLKNGGRFALCARPDRLVELLAALTACGLEPKRLQCVQSADGRPANLILLESAAQGKPGLELLPVLIAR